MKVLVTGGAGLIGRAAAVQLLAHGHEVHLIDIIPEIDEAHAPYAMCDIMDFNTIREQMQGCDAVVHMAALRSPLNGPGHDVYSINTVGTFNVFEAAAQLGIRRVVQASSINAIGCAWNVGDFTPQYFPVDENHPRITSDPYSFSKQQVEDIGDYFWRRDGISSVAFRFPGVYRAGVRQNPEMRERRDKMREYLEGFVQLPAEEQQRQLAAAHTIAMQYRAERQLEYPHKGWVLPTSDEVDDQLLRAYTLDRYNLWASIDERDAALAIEKALTADYEGSHPLFVSDPHNWLNLNSEMLARVFFPNTTQRKHTINGTESLVSVQKARDLIDFEPQHTLRGDHHVETR